MRIILTWLANPLLSVGKKSLRFVPVTLLNPTTPYAQYLKQQPVSYLSFLTRILTGIGGVRQGFTETRLATHSLLRMTLSYDLSASPPTC